MSELPRLEYPALMTVSGEEMREKDLLIKWLREELTTVMKELAEAKLENRRLKGEAE